MYDGNPNLESNGVCGACFMPKNTCKCTNANNEAPEDLDELSNRLALQPAGLTPEFNMIKLLNDPSYNLNPIIWQYSDNNRFITDFSKALKLLPPKLVMEAANKLQKTMEDEQNITPQTEKKLDGIYQVLLKTLLEFSPNTPINDLLDSNKNPALAEQMDVANNKATVSSMRKNNPMYNPFTTKPKMRGDGL